MLKRGREDFCIGIDLLAEQCQITSSNVTENTHHQANLEEVRGNTHENLDLAEKVKVQRGHTIVICDAGKEIHKDELAISLSSVARLLVMARFGLCPTLDNDDRWCTTASNSLKKE